MKIAINWDGLVITWGAPGSIVFEYDRQGLTPVEEELVLGFIRLAVRQAKFEGNASESEMVTFTTDAGKDLADRILGIAREYLPGRNIRYRIVDA